MLNHDNFSCGNLCGTNLLMKNEFSLCDYASTVQALQNLFSYNCNPYQLMTVHDSH